MSLNSEVKNMYNMGEAGPSHAEVASLEREGGNMSKCIILNECF